MHREEQHRAAHQQRDERHACGGHVHREDVAHRIADVLVNAPAKLHRGDDGPEVVLHQHERGRLARHVGAALAHRHADVRGLQRGRVVHAVAGHRDDLARGLERLHEAQLLCGPDAREHVDALHFDGQRCLVEGFDIDPGEHTGLVRNPGLRRNGERRAGMVPGHHHHANACAPAQRHGCWHFSTQRVGQANEAKPAEPERMRVGRPVAFAPLGLRNAQHAQAAPGRLVRACSLSCVCLEAAERQHGFRRPFDHDAMRPIRRTPGMAHREELLRQRIVVVQRPAFAQLRRRRTGGGEDRPLHRVERFRLAGERRRFQHLCRGHPARGQRFRHGHAVLGERTGLVDAEHRG